MSGGGTIDRQETVLLLKEIMAICESFSYAKVVSIEKEKQTGSWVLSVYWLPHPSEIACLEKIVVKYGLEMVTSNENTIFRSKNS